MKKQLLTLVALLFAAVTAMAQVELGAPKWNIKDGAKVSLNKAIQISFPNATGVDEDASIVIAGNIFAAGETQGDEPDFDGMEGTISAIDLVLPEILEEVQPKTTYTIVITSVLVNEEEQLGDGMDPIQITFTTRGGERKLSWNFASAITTAEKDSIQKHIDREAAKEDETERDPYWAVSGSDKKARFLYKKALNEDELCLPDGTPIAMTEGLYITTKADQLLVPQSTASTSVLRLHLAKANTVLIPDCKAGDKVTIKVSYVDTKSAYYLQIPGATCESATNEAKDSLATTKSAASYQFTVLEDGDLTVKVGNSCLYSIDIVEKTDYNPKYSVVAVDPHGNVVKTYVEETEDEAGALVKCCYSHWLKTAEDSLLTYGSVGAEMSLTFTLASDRTFVIKYKSTGIGGVVDLAEMEDLVNAEDLECPVQLLTTGNEAVRASKGKAAYVTSDYTITTVPAGTYKIYAGVFDKTKGGGSNQTFKVGEEEIIISSTSDNLSIVESSPFTVTEDNTPVVWLSNGSTQNGIDMIAIYATDDVPEEEPDGVSSVEAKANVTKAVRKVVNNGQLLIEGANGTFNVAGAQVK